jgi:hypothetical protein
MTWKLKLTLAFTSLSLSALGLGCMVTVCRWDSQETLG